MGVSGVSGYGQVGAYSSSQQTKSTGKTYTTDSSGNVQSASREDLVNQAKAMMETGSSSASMFKPVSVTQSKEYGSVVGSPKLSDAASSVYDDLKKKFGNTSFVLVDAGSKAAAHAQASRFANPNSFVVLIDEEKLERMATDENYRKQIESQITAAKSQFAASKLQNNPSVTSFGMKTGGDGKASFFATVKDSSKGQKERIEKKRAEKKEAKKAAEKKAEKKAKEAKIEERRTEKRAEDKERAESRRGDDLPDSYRKKFDEMADRIANGEHPGTGEVRGKIGPLYPRTPREEGFSLREPRGAEVTITAGSIEELERRVDESLFSRGAHGDARTDAEKAVGGSIDFKG